MELWTTNLLRILVEHTVAKWAAKWAKDSGLQASSTADLEAPNIADMVLSLWMHNVRKVQHQADAMKAGRTQENVGMWLDSVE